MYSCVYVCKLTEEIQVSWLNKIDYQGNGAICHVDNCYFFALFIVLSFVLYFKIYLCIF